MNRFAQSKKSLLESNKIEEVVEKVMEPSLEDEAQTEEKTPQIARKRKSKPIEYNLSIPLVKKNLQLPIELELAIKEC